MLESVGVGCNVSFLAKLNPELSRYLICEFFKAVTEWSIVVTLGLFVTFGAETFKKGPAVLLTEGVQNLRLEGLLTLISISYGRLGEFFKPLQDFRSKDLLFGRIFEPKNGSHQIQRRFCDRMWEVEKEHDEN